MVVRMRHTRSHTGNRRGHHALKKPALVTDKESGVVHLRHRVSPTTGIYKGRAVVDVSAKLVKKQKKLKEKNKALGKEVKAESEAK